MATEFVLYNTFMRPAWSYVNGLGYKKVVELHEEAKAALSKAWAEYKKLLASADYSIALSKPNTNEYYKTLNEFKDYKARLKKLLNDLKLRNNRAEWNVGFAIESAVQFLDDFSAVTPEPTRFFSFAKYIYERDILGKTSCTFYREHHRTYNITIADEDFHSYTDLVPIL